MYIVVQMYITVKGMLRWSIQKIKSNAIVYWVWYLVCINSVNIDIIEWSVDTVDMKIKACNAVNAMFVNTVDTGIHNTVYRVMRCENCTLLCIKCIDSVDIDSIECIRDPWPVSTVSTYIVMTVWLKSPQS